MNRKRIMGDPERIEKKICVQLRIDRDELRDELLKRTTYITVPLQGNGQDSEEYYDRLLLTADEDIWVGDRLQEAGDRVCEVLAGYLTGDGCTFDEQGHCCMTLLLPWCDRTGYGRPHCPYHQRDICAVCFDALVR